VTTWNQPCIKQVRQTTQPTKLATTTAKEYPRISSGNHFLMGDGQGKTIDFLGVLAQPQGDVNADGGTIKLPPAPHNRVGWQRPERANSNNLHPYNVKTDQGQHISTHAQHVKGSTMMNKSQGASNHLNGLLPPVLEATGSLVAGKDIKKLCLQNKRRQHALQEQQPTLSVWTTHQRDTVLPPSTPLPERWRGEMCPSGIATSHPAGELLKEWALVGCPAQTGHPWTKSEIWEAVERGPHRSALSEEVLEHFTAESVEKVNAGQARIVEWDWIKENPPTQLKISPIAAIPHNSRGLRSILDLSFSLRLKNGGILHLVNDTTTKMAPKGASDQLGHALSRIIHAFTESEDTNDAKIFMAKWDVKDGFWQMCCEDGKEWNFTYVLPQRTGAPIWLVVPTSLQMGWVESPPYFCASSETA
jgi:hypothetical protein